jgi:NADH-quinone oxidoreductase subunit K
MIPIAYYFILSTILFVVGTLIVLYRKNLVFILMGIEFILNASTINFVAMSKYDPEYSGQILAMAIIVVAACEAVVALSIIILLYKHYNSTNLEDIKAIKE